MDNPTLEQVLPNQEDIQLVDINLIKLVQVMLQKTTIQLYYMS